MEREFVTTYIVAGVVIKQDNKYLLVQEKQPKVFGLWNFPAGRVDVGDTIEQTAIKEAREETGYEVELLDKIDIFQESINEPPHHAFVAKIKSGELNYPKDEILDVKWFSLEEIKIMKNKLRGNWILNAINILESGNN